MLIFVNEALLTLIPHGECHSLTVCVEARRAKKPRSNLGEERTFFRKDDSV